MTQFIGRDILEQTLLFYPDMFAKGYIFCSNITPGKDPLDYNETLEKLNEYYSNGHTMSFGRMGDFRAVGKVEEFPELPAFMAIHEVKIDAIPVFVRIEKISPPEEKNLIPTKYKEYKK